MLGDLYGVSAVATKTISQSKHCQLLSMAYGYRKVADSDICGVINHVSGRKEIREPFV